MANEYGKDTYTQQAGTSQQTYFVQQYFHRCDTCS